MPDELPLYKDYSQRCECFPGIQRILAFASLGEKEKRDPAAKPKNWAARQEKTNFPWGSAPL